jgi:predicted enzyme related to lactoylglutathione lyase
MSTFQPPAIGTVGWFDLTVADATGVRDFYQQVVGWDAAPHDMGTYNDFDIKAPGSDDVITGICHARDTNAKIPPVWMIYITVEDVDFASAKCVELGGTILDGPRKMGYSDFCVIKDPAGAICALITPPDLPDDVLEMINSQ